MEGGGAARRETRQPSAEGGEAFKKTGHVVDNTVPMNLESGFHQLCIYTENETKYSLRPQLPARLRNHLGAEAERLICDLFYLKKSSKACKENAVLHPLCDAIRCY